MKSLYVTFTEREYNTLRKARAKVNDTYSWRAYLLQTAREILNEKLKGGNEDDKDKTNNIRT